MLYIRSPAAFLDDSIFSPQDVDEALHCVRLPTRSFHDLGKARALGLRRIGRWLAYVLSIDCVLAHWFLLDRVAVVTFISGGEKQ